MMTDYAIEGSDYERLQRENERLKAERDLLIKAHKIFMSRRMQYEFQMLDQWSDDGVVESVGGMQLTVADLKRLREMIALHAANDDGAR